MYNVQEGDRVSLRLTRPANGAEVLALQISISALTLPDEITS